MSDAVEWASALSGASGMGLGLILTKILNRRKETLELKRAAAEGTKLDAEAAQIIASTAVALVAPLQSQIAILTSRVEAVEAENTSTRKLLQAAVGYIRDLQSWIKIHLPQRVPPKAPIELEIELYRSAP